jgi:alpha-beta hydrolase superfamily lysophospholipase
MKNEQYGWKTADGVRISAEVRRPDGAPVAAVAFVHGLGEHIGRYLHVAKAFTDAGYVFNAFDHRGHGKSGGPRLFAPSYEALMGDIDIHLERTRKLAPGVPLFIYGHSMGGNVVLYYILTRKPAVAGAVASSPGLGSGTPQPPVKMLFGRIMNRLIPTLRIPTGFPPGGLSRDPAVLGKVNTDKLFQAGVSVRLGLEILRAGAWIRTQTESPCPLLIMQGTADKYVDPSMTAAFAKALRGDITYKEWEGAYHELHNETMKEQVLAYILDWMGKKRGGGR